MSELLPKSGNIIHGGMFVITETGECVRVRELPPASSHKLFGPAGIVQVQLFEAPTRFEDLLEMIAEDSYGNGLCYFLSSDQVLAPDLSHVPVSSGNSYNGKKVQNGALVPTEITLSRVGLSNTQGVDCYQLSDCDIYVGAGLQKTFLPFRVYNELSGVRIQ
jgi:hypothetical protein